MAYEVFISFKRNALNGSGLTRDFQLAADLYKTLTNAGVKVFFSEKDLSASAFIREIYKALDEAKIQVIVGTKPEYVTSEWVHAEWETFLSAILGGRKRNGEIYTFLEGMTVNELPLELYNRQSFDSNQKDALVYRVLSHLGKTAPKPQPIQKPVSQPQPVQQPVQQPAQQTTPSPRMNLRVGDKIPFGRYPQGANGEIEPLMWRVLAVESGRALLITDKLIDCVRYHETDTKVTWETCSLRRWMNNVFINKAFSNSEQILIATVTILNLERGLFGLKEGNSTTDKIYALSINEAKKYFHNDNDRMAAPTDYAKKCGVWISEYYLLKDDKKTGWWWLRSPGYCGNSAAHIAPNGLIIRLGNNVDSDTGSVRPALWLNPQ